MADLSLLDRVLIDVFIYLDKIGIELSPKHTARLIGELYNHCLRRKESSVDEDTIRAYMIN